MSDGNSPHLQRRPDRAALAIAAALAVVAIVIAWSTSQAGGVAGYSPVGPKTFPYIIAGGMFLLSLCTAIEAWRGNFPAREAQNIPPMLWVLGGLAVQMLSMKTVGFSIATGLLFAATAKGFGKGPLWMTVPIGIVFAFLVWVMFAKGLQLTLPAGPLERLF
ncbi:tripartite tricarboxylate transporter TctB family protein [Oryzicola mucosus]|uniref:Tripartite tricarboxylate transporter TctB family protein n=1 Tax=Oryzicola mucosus TaxID=2767425 RepID=A0A8J6PHA3_9HYPH|nr:tripartite tricarboxylate transporter TctB family protein [Oryzicola mucosus]MBD0413421.1 tripartite tricarboxylate transporter TctB family protein [Oryzicola mucosus]